MTGLTCERRNGSGLCTIKDPRLIPSPFFFLGPLFFPSQLCRVQHSVDTEIPTSFFLSPLS